MFTLYSPNESMKYFIFYESRVKEKIKNYFFGLYSSGMNNFSFEGRARDSRDEHFAGI